MMLRRIPRFLSSLLHPQGPRPCIMMYHRTIVLDLDPWGLAVRPHIFERQIAYFSSSRTPMSMQTLVERLVARDLPANAIAVTFDDAYRDNLVVAKPILERYRVPATVFVPTGLIGSQAPFWWDELARMILRCPTSQSFLQPCADEQIPLQWSALQPADYDPDWRAWLEPQTARQAAYIRLWKKMQRASGQQRREAMALLRARLPVRLPEIDQPMTQTELNELCAGGLVSLGAHTVTHPALTALSPAECRLELLDGLTACQALAPGASIGFAYPYGDRDPQVEAAVQTAGFPWACTTQAGFLDRTVNLHALPRITASNVTGRHLKHQTGNSV